jgi:hypothetical protein
MHAFFSYCEILSKWVKCMDSPCSAQLTFWAEEARWGRGLALACDFLILLMEIHKKAITFKP